MFCRYCGSDKFIVLKVNRERRYDVRRRSYLPDDDIDTRLIVCDVCGRRYITETMIIAEIGYDEQRNQQLTLSLTDKRLKDE